LKEKKLISFFLVFIFIMALALVLSDMPAQAAIAQTFTADTAEGVSVEYKVLTENTSEHTGTVQVGTGLTDDTAINLSYTGTVTIPSTVEYGGITYTVTEIAYKAMYDCNLTGIDLPNTLSVIGAFAFNDTDITQIELPLSLSRINGYAFSNCHGLTTVIVPEGTVFIGGGAFSGCSNLARVTMPDSLTVLPDYLFKDCVSLEEVILGSNVENIGYQAFYGCTSLTRIDLPASVTEIRSDAFRNCSTLADVYFDGNAPTLDGANHFVGVANPAYGNVYETAAGFPLIGQDYYGLTIKQRDNNAQKPLITSLSPCLVVRVGDDASLTVNASVLDGGTLSYQWYVNSIKQNTGGTLIPGATDFTYVLPTATTGVDYYYVVVTNTNTAATGTQTAFSTSSPITVTVYEATDAETPVITVQPADVTADQGTTVTLSVEVKPLSDGGTLTYAWYENTVNSYTGGSFVSSESSMIAPYIGVRYYYVVVTNKNTEVSGTKTASVTSDIARVTINPLIDAKEPEIVDQPQDVNITVNQPVTLSVNAVSVDDGILSYQWFSNNFQSYLGSCLIADATEASYSPSTAIPGTYYYYVVVTNTNNDLNGTKTATKASNIVSVGVGGQTYTITVQNDGNGTAGATPNPAGLGQTVQLGYLANSGYQFKEWQVISGDIFIQSNNTFMMPDTDVTVKAIFEDIPDYTVTVSTDGNGVAVAEPDAADAGTLITISAENFPSYKFKEWQVVTGEVSLASSTSTSTTFTMPAGNVEVKAVFENITLGSYTLNLQSTAGGTAVCDGGTAVTYSQSTLVNLWTFPQSGYVFKEWQVAYGTFDAANITSPAENWYQFMMPNSDLVLLAVFESSGPVTYNVTVQDDGNGTAWASPSTAAEGDTITLSNNPDSGYQLKEWQVISGGVIIAGNTFTMPDNDVTVKAVFEEIPAATYTITVQDDGNGTGSAVPNPASEGETITLSNDPDSGYQFKDWQVISGGVTISGNTFTMPAGDVTVKATFDVIPLGTYTVSFDANGGTGSMSDQTFTEGVTQALTANAFYLTDYNFLGWAQTPTGGVIYTDGESILVSYDRTLYAVWAPVSAPQYTVTFDANGGSGTMSPQTFTQGVAQPLSGNAFTRAGHSFEGWALTPTGGVSFNDRASLSVGGDTQLYAVWSEISITTYTVTVQDDGYGTGSANPSTASKGDTIILSNNPNSGYQFKEWQVISGGVTITGNTFTMPDNDVTVKAIFEEMPVVTYNITVEDDGNGTGSASPSKAAEGETINLSSDPDSGYRFKEWEVVSGGVSITGNTFTMPDNDVTVKAIFEEIPIVTYDVTVEDDGNGTGSASPSTAAEGETITLSSDPDSGYRFKEWQVISGGVIITGNTFTMPDNDVTVKAIFEEIPPVTYSITIQDDGNGTGSAVPNPASEGETVTLSSMPDAGYQFDEWQVISGAVTISGNTFTMPASDVTVKAIFEEIPIVNYDVTVEDDGNGTGSASPSKAAEGETITLSSDPDSGYRFKEWQVISGGVSITGNTFTMPDNDVTVRAVFRTLPAGSGSSTPESISLDEANPPATSLVPDQPETPSMNFSDVKESDWFNESVEYVYQKGLMLGTTGNQFSPQFITSRAMIVAILYRMEGSTSGSGNSFSDVADGQWYTDAVAWASANKIVAGYGNWLFGPNDNITREQLAVILYNYAKYKGYDITSAQVLNSFSDSDRVSPWARNAVEWAVGSNLLFGKGNNTLAPADSTTRAELATIIQRFIENVAK